ncbi:hypothetical protein D3C72_2177160 [compost metagenome]
MDQYSTGTQRHIAERQRRVLVDDAKGPAGMVGCRITGDHYGADYPGYGIGSGSAGLNDAGYII